MQGIFRALLFWTLILCACSSGISSPQTVLPPTPETSLPTTAVPSNSQECGYQWAYKDLPELSQQFQKEIHALNPGAVARATAFGEDCVYADGRREFSAMETDFYVESPAGDLNDHKSLGDWMAQVMPVVEALPDEMIAGPQPGFVEFKFIKSEMEFLFVRVPIHKYRETASSKTGAELFDTFYTEP